MNDASLHLNLLQDDERFGSSPVRARVMIPLLAVLAVVGLGVWWLLLIARVGNVTNERRFWRRIAQNSSQRMIRFGVACS